MPTGPEASEAAESQFPMAGTPLTATLRSASIIAGLSAITLGAGLVFQIVLAEELGAGNFMDIYLVAIGPPAFVATALLSAITLAMVPSFGRILKDESSGLARRVFLRTARAITPYCVAIGIFLAFAADGIIHVLGPGLDLRSADLAAEMLRVMSLAATIDIYRGVLTALYYARGQFSLPQLVPTLNHVVMIISAKTLYSWIGLRGLAIGWMVGSIVMFGVLVLGLVREANALSNNHEKGIDARRLSKHLPASLAVIAFTQAIPIVDRAVGSTLSTGAISYLGYGNKVLEILMRTTPMAVVLATYPLMSRQASTGDWPSLQNTVGRGIRWLILTTLPISVLAYSLREPAISLLFERGAFSHPDALAVSAVVRWYAIALLPAGMVYMLSHLYFSIGRPGILVAIGALQLAVTLGLDYFLAQVAGHPGIAMAYLVVAILTASALLALAGKSGFPIRLNFEIRWILQVTIAAGIMVGITSILISFVDELGLGTLREIVYVAGVSSFGVALYAIVLKFLGLPEAGEAAALVRRFARELEPKRNF